MANNYYGVREGRVPGVYDNWEETEAQVLRFSGGKQRGFPTRAEAERYVYGRSLNSQETKTGRSEPSEYSAVRGLDPGSGSIGDVRAALLRTSFQVYGGQEALLVWVDGALATGAIQLTAAQWVRLQVALLGDTR